MGLREFHIEGRMIQFKSDKWEVVPPPHGTTTKLTSLSVVTLSDGTNQLHLHTTSIQGGPTKVIVEDLTSSSLRMKLEKENYVQWTYKQDAFGLRCKSPEEAREFLNLLQECQRGERNGNLEQGNPRNSTRSLGSLGDEELDSNDKPLHRVGQFQPLMRRSNSVKRTNSSGFGGFEGLQFKALDSMKSEAKAERAMIVERIAHLETMMIKILDNQDQIIRLNQRPSSTELRTVATTPTNSPSSVSLPPPPPPPPGMGYSEPKAFTTQGQSPCPPPPPPPMSSMGSTSGGSAPPPPPPPPPMSGSGGAPSLASQIQAAKLKKSGEGEGSTNEEKPKAATLGMDFSSELQAKIRKRPGNSHNGLPEVVSLDEFDQMDESFGNVDFTNSENVVVLDQDYVLGADEIVLGEIPVKEQVFGAANRKQLSLPPRPPIQGQLPRGQLPRGQPPRGQPSRGQPPIYRPPNPLPRPARGPRNPAPYRGRPRPQRKELRQLGPGQGGYDGSGGQGPDYGNYDYGDYNEEGEVSEYGDYGPGGEGNNNYQETGIQGPPLSGPPGSGYNRPGNGPEDYNESGPPTSGYNRPGNGQEDYNESGPPGPGFKRPGGEQDDYNESGPGLNDYPPTAPRNGRPGRFRNGPNGYNQGGPGGPRTRGGPRPRGGPGSRGRFRGATPGLNFQGGQGPNFQGGPGPNFQGGPGRPNFQGRPGPPKFRRGGPGQAGPNYGGRPGPGRLPLNGGPNKYNVNGPNHLKGPGFGNDVPNYDEEEEEEYGQYDEEYPEYPEYSPGPPSAPPLHPSQQPGRGPPRRSRPRTPPGPPNQAHEYPSGPGLAQFNQDLGPAGPSGGPPGLARGRVPGILTPDSVNDNNGIPEYGEYEYTDRGPQNSLGEGIGSGIEFDGEEIPILRNADPLPVYYTEIDSQSEYPTPDPDQISDDVMDKLYNVYKKARSLNQTIPLHGFDVASGSAVIQRRLSGINTFISQITSGTFDDLVAAASTLGSVVGLLFSQFDAITALGIVAALEARATYDPEFRSSFPKILQQNPWILPPKKYKLIPRRPAPKLVPVKPVGGGFVGRLPSFRPSSGGRGRGFGSSKFTTFTPEITSHRHRYKPRRPTSQEAPTEYGYIKEGHNTVDDIPVYRPDSSPNVDYHETETIVPPPEFSSDIHFTQEFAPPDIRNDKGFIQGKPLGFPSLKQLIGMVERKVNAISRPNKDELMASVEEMVHASCANGIEKFKTVALYKGRNVNYIVGCVKTYLLAKDS
eukprot:maker-scaffold89_size390429-snap-gene-0.16 protein:Tk12446 transcript:maker-scaffold89_size390429-snap-gene-0.16-mRNA-1 annotation:"PREDICTED: uncharacterized protein LOC100122795"